MLHHYTVVGITLTTFATWVAYVATDGFGSPHYFCRRNSLREEEQERRHREKVGDTDHGPHGDYWNYLPQHLLKIRFAPDE